MPEESPESCVPGTERSARLGIVATFALGLRRRNPGAVANAVAAFAGTLVPGLVEDRYGVEFRPWQRAYVAAAMLFHSTGMLGPYDDVWWWDHLTHTLSASILGGVVHAVVRRRGRDPAPLVLGGVLGVGAAWELAEYLVHRGADRLGVEPLLIQYGEHDTAFDLIFDLVGALLVLAFGDALLSNFTGGDE